MCTSSPVLEHMVKKSANVATMVSAPTAVVITPKTPSTLIVPACPRLRGRRTRAYQRFGQE